MASSRRIPALFSISHMGFAAWYGEFTKVSGSLDLNPKSLGDPYPGRFDLDQQRQAQW